MSGSVGMLNQVSGNDMTNEVSFRVLARRELYCELIIFSFSAERVGPRRAWRIDEAHDRVAEQGERTTE